MINYLIVSHKIWHQEISDRLQEKLSGNWSTINSVDDFTLEKLEELNPNRIFVLHWSYIIPEVIFGRYECIVFHMTDLPYGRGGSPLQNLIVRGHKSTMVSALQVVKELDAGPVYLKAPLSLEGTAQEIFERSAQVVEGMIVEILSTNPPPVAQVGESTIFKRRKPEDGNLQDIGTLVKIYDFIRMLDCEGYPAAFLQTDHFRFEFTNASLNGDESIIAHVRIIKK